MRRFVIALALALVCAAGPATARADDQEIAQAIVTRLREFQQAGQLKDFDIDMSVENGRVWLKGDVANIQQHTIAIETASQVPGVKLVVNDLKIQGEKRDYDDGVAPPQTAPAALAGSTGNATAQPARASQTPATLAAQSQATPVPAAAQNENQQAASNSQNQPKGLVNGRGFLAGLFGRGKKNDNQQQESNTGSSRYGRHAASHERQPAANATAASQSVAKQPQGEAKPQQDRVAKLSQPTINDVPKPASQVAQLAPAGAEVKPASLSVQTPQPRKSDSLGVMQEQHATVEAQLPSARRDNVPARQMPQPSASKWAVPRLAMGETSDNTQVSTAADESPESFVTGQATSSQLAQKQQLAEELAQQKQLAEELAKQKEMARQQLAQQQEFAKQQLAQQQQLADQLAQQKQFAEQLAQQKQFAEQLAEQKKLAQEAAQAAAQASPSDVAKIEPSPMIRFSPETAEAKPSVEKASAVAADAAEQSVASKEAAGGTSSPSWSNGTAGQPGQDAAYAYAANQALAQQQAMFAASQPWMWSPYPVDPRLAMASYGPAAGPQQQARPVAYAASQLPGSPAYVPMQQQMRPAGYNVAMAQSMQAQGMGPAPQFIQGTGGGVQPARYDHPQMPGYAWPSYASSPNYAALQYPKHYSAHAWPYIGPFYPYPQVPLGWRKVTLSWDDGWWWLDFKDRGYGPYITR